MRFDLWRDAAIGCYSVEPCYGLHNSLASRDGDVRLAPGQSFHWTTDLAIKRAKTMKKQIP